MVLKNKSFFKKLIAATVFVLSVSSVFALAVPDYNGRVNDLANIINKNDEAELNNYLNQLDEQTGVQMMVLTIPSLQGEDIATYSFKVADKWGIGHKGTDKGALLIVAMEEHDVRIEVGDGLEDKLTDMKCGLILRNVIVPEFKNGAYSSGIVKGIKNMGGVATDNAELVEKSVLNDKQEDDDIAGLFFMIIWLIFFFIIVSSKGGLWKWFFLSRLFGGRPRYRNYNRHGPYVPPRNTGFGGPGFGGGGFHTGGGHFSGGGASAKW